MGRRALALILAVLALGACSQDQQNAYEHLERPALPKNNITSVAFSRLGCRGRCPIYTLSYSRGDSAAYEGNAYVDKLGKYSGMIDFDLISAWLDSQDLDEYAGHYGMNVMDAEVVRLTISRTNRTVVIDSHYTGALPLRVQGVIAALDGFAEGVRWTPASAIDSYLGYFLNDSTPGELFAIYFVPGNGAVDAKGDSHLTSRVKCTDSVFPSDQFKIDLSITGSHAVGREVAYNNIAGEFGPKTPLDVAIEPGGLSVGDATQKRSYRRVTWREYQSEEDAMFKRCHPTT